MKGFKFKLDALLKLKEFNEKRVKTELGEILKEISEVKEKMNLITKSIEETYASQEAVLEDPSQAQMLQFFPFYIKSRKDDFDIQQAQLEKWQEKYQDKLEDLKAARGEVKVLDNMKDKKRTEFKKQKNKKETEDIEDVLNLRRNLSKLEKRNEES